MGKKLGDIVESVIGKIAPKTAAKAKSRGCGCGKRKEALNKADDSVRKFLNLND